MNRLNRKVYKVKRLRTINIMKIQNKLIVLCISLFLLISFVGATHVCEIYDDFSSGILNESKWEINQDYEGQPLIENYGINNLSENFYTKQNIYGNKRLYLTPRYNFKINDTFNWDVNYISGSGNGIFNFLIEKADGNFDRNILGIGHWNYDLDDDFGIYHISLKFMFPLLKIYVNDNFIRNYYLEESPNNIFIGTAFGHNGRGNFEYDNFELCTEKEEINQTIEINQTNNEEGNNETEIDRLEQKIKQLEKRTSWIESILDKILTFIKNLRKY